MYSTDDRFYFILYNKNYNLDHVPNILNAAEKKGYFAASC